jgi:hypothetical protein
MRIKNFGNTSVAGVDFASSDRQAALRAMHRVKSELTPQSWTDKSD